MGMQAARRRSRPRAARRAATVLLPAVVLACSGLRTPGPHPSLTPADVVVAQLDALSRRGDDGIARAYRFASPANRRAIGSVDRFERVVRSPGYAPMLDHRSAELGPERVEGGRAAVAVALTAADGSRHAYLFELSRQRDGAWTGCWMTDSVLVMTPREPVGQEL